jgi:hypothetical protein
MRQRTNYYEDLSADYSKPEPVSYELVIQLLNDAETYISLREETLPEITSFRIHLSADRTGKQGVVANPL